MNWSAAQASGPIIRPMTCSPGAVAGFSGRDSLKSFTSQQPGNEVDNEPDGQPGEHHEVPVVAVLGGVHETPALDGTGEEEHSEDYGIEPVSDEVDGVQPQHRPDDRSVGVGVPLAVQRFELAHAEQDVDHA